MTRREMFAAIAILTGVVPVAPAVPLREFRRFDRAADKWVPVSGFDIRDRDVVWITDRNEVLCVLKSDPADRSFTVDYKIDPVSNQWVPV